MTKRDYQKFAAIIAGEIAMASMFVNASGITGAAHGAQRQTAVNIARSFADIAHQENSRFDRDTFYNACGMQCEIDPTTDARFWS